MEISCLPTGWTYTVTETNSGSNYRTSYKLNSSDVQSGTAAGFTTSETGKDTLAFTNASTIAPPETGRDMHNSEWILLLIMMLTISAGSMTVLKKLRKHN